MLRSRENLAHYLERINVKCKISALPEGFTALQFRPPDRKKVLSVVQALSFAIIRAHEYEYSYGKNPDADLIIF